MYCLLSSSWIFMLGTIKPNGCSLKQLMTELSTAYGPSCVSYDTVRQWRKKSESGVESIKNAPKSCRPKSVSRKEIVSKI